MSIRQAQGDEERRRREEEAQDAINAYAEAMTRRDLGHRKPIGNTFEPHGPLLAGPDGELYREQRLK